MGNYLPFYRTRSQESNREKVSTDERERVRGEIENAEEWEERMRGDRRQMRTKTAKKWMNKGCRDWATLAVLTLVRVSIRKIWKGECSHVILDKEI